MRIVLLAAACLPVFAQAQTAEPPPARDAARIMARVAANQDASESQRTHYLYVQHARVLSRKGKSVRCEETTDTRVTPTPTGSDRQLLKLEGRLFVKHAYRTYDHLPSNKEVGISDVNPGEQELSVSLDDSGEMDRDLVENMRDNLTNDKSKDGLGSKLFPLTSKTQANYIFELVGREHLNGRNVFHIAFTPKQQEESSWKGDAYIDETAYQPVLVRTAMSRKIPFAVRTLLGTNLPGLGFTVIYAEQPGGVWFPTSFGTEFKMRVLFVISRTIVLSAENRSFEQTHASSRIVPPTE